MEEYTSCQEYGCDMSLYRSRTDGKYYMRCNDCGQQYELDEDDDHYQSLTEAYEKENE